MPYYRDLITQPLLASAASGTPPAQGCPETEVCGSRHLRVDPLEQFLASTCSLLDQLWAKKGPRETFCEPVLLPHLRGSWLLRGEGSQQIHVCDPDRLQAQQNCPDQTWGPRG